MRVVAGREVMMMDRGNRVLCFYRTTTGAVGDVGNDGATMKKEATVVARLGVASPTIAEEGRSSGCCYNPRGVGSGGEGGNGGDCLTEGWDR